MAVLYGAGLSGDRWPFFNAALAVILAVALWTTIDLDHPRAGFISLSDAPMRELVLDAPVPSEATP